MKRVIETIQYDFSKYLLNLQMLGDSNQQSMLVAIIIMLLIA